RVMAFPVKPINIAAAVATWGHPPPAVPGEAKLHRGLGASDYGSSTPIFTGNSFVRNIPATCRHYCGDSDMLFEPGEPKDSLGGLRAVFFLSETVCYGVSDPVRPSGARQLFLHL